MRALAIVYITLGLATINGALIGLAFALGYYLAMPVEPPPPPLTSDIVAAFTAGQQACRDGAPGNADPFVGTPKSQWWTDGWMTEKQAIQLR